MELVRVAPESLSEAFEPTLCVSELWRTCGLLALRGFGALRNHSQSGLRFQHLAYAQGGIALQYAPQGAPKTPWLPFEPALRFIDFPPRSPTLNVVALYASRATGY